MTQTLFQRSFLAVVVTVTIAVVAPGVLIASDPFLRFRADPNALTMDVDGVTTWGESSAKARAQSSAGMPRPKYVQKAVNGHGALNFPGNAFLTVDNAECFKGSYTLYVVMKHDGTVGANNIVSGNAHAFWLGNDVYPRMLHNGDFAQQAVSNVAVAGWCVVRASFDATTGRARIAVNNVEGVSTTIPQTTDPTFLIGAFQGSNFFHGDIAEVVYYHGVLSDADRKIEDERLHTRYNISRALDPKPPVVQFSKAPKHLQIMPIGDSLRIRGVVLDSSILTLALKIDSHGVVTDERVWTVATDGYAFAYTRGFPVPNVHEYNVLMTASRSGTRDTVLKVDSITTGVVLAVSGQSNSVFGNPNGTKNALARTFGKNASPSSNDTVWTLSDPTTSGGGSTVGAAAMQIQNRFIARNLPSAVINGGVGGTTIQQHLPNASFSEALTTIHGSWAYRRRVADVNNYINFLIWYQGESNSGTENYAALFDSLYNQWHLEMPNLKHILVVQIHTGCGGDEHALLREQQRQLQHTYPDVTVFGTGNLPGHDGCHYLPEGYARLGDILGNNIDSADFGGTRPLSQSWSSPDLSSATYTNDEKTKLVLRFRGYGGFVPSLLMASEMSVDGSTYTQHYAFFANGDESLRPIRVTVKDDAVDLWFPVAVQTISYVPSRYYAGTTTVYQGPWLTNARGVGALTFHNAPVTVLNTVDDADARNVIMLKRLVHSGDYVELGGHHASAEDLAAPATFYDLHGTAVATINSSLKGGIVIPPLASAPYTVVSGTHRVILLVQ